MHTRGFTLAEVLIALALLGIVATYTIPKILGYQQQQATRIMLQETVATLESTYYTIKLNKDFPPGNSLTLYQVLAPHFNYLHTNPSNFVSSVLGASHPFTNGTAPNPACAGPGWFVLSNGVVIGGLSGLGYSRSFFETGSPSGFSSPICIDVNGKAPQMYWEKISFMPISVRPVILMGLQGLCIPTA